MVDSDKIVSSIIDRIEDYYEKKDELVKMSDTVNELNLTTKDLYSDIMLESINCIDDIKNIIIGNI